jgi:hypothetical protein
VFFGYEMMTVKEAEAFIAADEAITGGDKTALTKLINDQKGALSAAEKNTGLIRVPTRVSMLELGFSPTFYQFVDTIIEVKIAIKITRTIETSRSRRDTANQSSNRSARSAGIGFGGGMLGVRSGAANSSQATTSQVDATYSAKYGYSAEGSSLLRTKLVPLILNSFSPFSMGSCPTTAEPVYSPIILRRHMPTPNFVTDSCKRWRTERGVDLLSNRRASASSRNISNQPKRRHCSLPRHRQWRMDWPTSSPPTSCT